MKRINSPPSSPSPPSPSSSPPTSSRSRQPSHSSSSSSTATPPSPLVHFSPSPSTPSPPSQPSSNPASPASLASSSSTASAPSDSSGSSTASPPTPPVPYNFLEPTTSSENLPEPKSFYHSNRDETDSIKGWVRTSWPISADYSDTPLFISLYNLAPSILQNGPVCGLVAAQIAAEALGIDSLTADILFDKARKKSFTCQGEMFSAANMATLLEDSELLKATIVKDPQEKVDDMMDHILKGWPIMVPYDADLNHEPCCRRGYRAHWATLVGFCVTIEKTKENMDSLCERFTQDDEEDRLFFAQKCTDYGPNYWRELNSLETYFYAKQGKSPRIQFMKSDQLFESNLNLQEYRPDKYKEFVIPSEGLAQSLGNQVLFISPVEKV